MANCLCLSAGRSLHISCLPYVRVSEADRPPHPSSRNYPASNLFFRDGSVIGRRKRCVCNIDACSASPFGLSPSDFSTASMSPSLLPVAANLPSSRTTSIVMVIYAVSLMFTVGAPCTQSDRTLPRRARPVNLLSRVHIGCRAEPRGALRRFAATFLVARNP